MKKGEYITLGVYLVFGSLVAFYLIGLAINRELLINVVDQVTNQVVSVFSTIGIIVLSLVVLLLLIKYIIKPLCNLVTAFQNNKWLWARTLAILGLLYATKPLPHDQYILLKFVVCVISLHTAYKAKVQQETGWTWVMAILVVLFNPFIPIHLSADTWKIVDWIVAIIMGISLKCHIGKDNFPLYTAEAETGHQILPMEQNTESSNTPHVYTHHSK